MQEYRFIPIDQIQPENAVEGFYLLKTASAKTTNAGKPFLIGKLQDITGEIDFVIWDYDYSVTEADTGSVVKIRGSASTYNGNTQIQIIRIRKSTESDKVDLDRIVPVAPIDADKALQEVKDMIVAMPDEDYRRICEEMLQIHLNALKKIPAAKSVHHAFVRGLLMHTKNMMHLAGVVGNMYADTPIDCSLLVAGAFCHDLAKEQELLISDVGLVTDYSINGRLLGHTYMGARDVAEVGNRLSVPTEKTLLLQHLLLSHHGEPEKGAAVVPMCAEAELLHMIDLIDSRMEIYREANAKTNPGEFSDKIWALGHSIYHVQAEEA